MNFKDYFLSSAHSQKMANAEADAALLLPAIYHYSKELPVSHDEYLYLEAGGTIRSSQLFSFSLPALDRILLIYTTLGGGRLTYSGRQLAMTENNLLLFDCSMPFSLQALMLPWHFKLFFIGGSSLKLFTSLPNSTGAALFTLPPHSPLIDDLYHLLSLPTDIHFPELLNMHSRLTNLLCATCQPPHDTVRCPNSEVPHYLTEMKNYFDHHYHEPFSLEYYETLLNINKYRLCREFSRTFGDSPLRYLNNRRLQAAKEILLTTDLNIHEISSIVGYENVNHFINLFKKRFDTTPNVFRQKALASPPVLHCPVQ